ncbi:hypothetical protein GCM10010451_42580 [Streptomyces virens]|uniref:Integral membrane protein n=1 Tax=Streptomyces virens TaxID=285572 RepID=A0ABP6PT45_9ACTN|nr:MULTISPECIES: hypothetical protein [Streptomyces]MBA8977209.1 hypothetical protein [Streptomyces calvus]MYS28393.1 hypothetical protein [Streptomyces sp. SID7804]
MAHAAPRSGRTAERAGQADLFGPRAHRAAKLAVPALVGLVFGYWAAANRRDAGPVTGWNLLFGFLTALVFALVFMALLALAPKLRREMHAVAWAAFSGTAVAFLFNQADGSVLRSTALGLAVAAGVFAVMFYRFFTHEDAAGHRTG